MRTEAGGKLVDDFLCYLLEKRGIGLRTSFLGNPQELGAFGVVDDILCKYGECLDERPQVLRAKDFEFKSYELPDGQTLKVGPERFLCAEVLFEPTICPLYSGREIPPIQDMISFSVDTCELDLRKELMKNIVLCGGVAQIKNVDKRLQKEVRVSGKHAKVALIDEERDVWVGGSVLASLPTLNWIEKEEYDECGPMIVHRKCF